MALKRAARTLSLLLALVLFFVPLAHALTLEQARELLEEYYVDPLPAGTLEKGTVAEMISAVGDPYTVLMSAEEYAAFMASMNDTEVVGIGISAGAHADGLLISGVFAGSPAEEGGLVAGDIIIDVDGTKVGGMSSEAITTLIRGDEGSQVTITVLRADGSTKTVTLTRSPVVIPMTTSYLIDDHIGVILCDTFGDETVDHFQEAFDAYGAVTDRWLVDLRYNPGGLTVAAANAAGLFLGQRVMMYLRDNLGDYYYYLSETKSRTLSPVIVLTSQYTASSSELFAGAVRDAKGGILVGARTYGKGIAQIILDNLTHPGYFDDGTALKITVSRYFSPLGASCDQIGLLPHLMISDENTPVVAVLLSESTPLPADCPDYLRIDLGSWRFYLHLKTALFADNRAAFVEILEAVTPYTNLYHGTSSGTWVATTAQALATEYSLNDYRPRTFTDVASSAYRDQINTLATYGILKGTGDGTFKPQDALSRAELCALLAQAMNYTPISGPSPFADVPEREWYTPYVNALYALGIVNGYDDGLFHPLESVNHEQFIAILARTAQRLNLYTYESALEVTAADLAAPSLAAFSPWAREYAWLLSGGATDAMGFSYNHLFDEVEQIDPDEASLREEAALLIFNVLSTSQILVP